MPLLVPEGQFFFDGNLVFFWVPHRKW